MNDGQSTTHPEPDPTPFKVHLLTRAGRVMRARSRCERFPIRTKPSDLRVASLAGTTRCTTSTRKFGPPHNEKFAVPIRSRRRPRYS
jgi:hypothetical protein